MVSSQPFKWRHFHAEIILLNVRWYCRYPLSYRNLEEMMRERGLNVNHSTINRWVRDLWDFVGESNRFVHKCHTSCRDE